MRNLWEKNGQVDEKPFFKPDFLNLIPYGF